ncbi:ribbon-helix-helix domain-containing protein [Rhizobacter fulvus]
MNPTVKLYAHMHVRNPSGSAAKSALRKRAKSDVPVYDEQSDDTVRISVLISKDQRHKLKVLAATRGVTISEVVRQGIDTFLEGEA